MASAPTTIPLRFQRQELQQKGNLSPEALALLARVAGPSELLAGIAEQDAVSALALMLPRRQTVWWACLAVRLIPDLERRPAELAALAAAESWVQTTADEDAERAFSAAEACVFSGAAAWAAMAAHWSGSSIAPRGQAAVAPAAHLAGVAARAAVILTVHDPAVAGRIGYGGLLAIGMELMHGELGRRAQAAARERIASGG